MLFLRLQNQFTKRRTNNWETQVSLRGTDIPRWAIVIVGYETNGTNWDGIQPSPPDNGVNALLAYSVVIRRYTVYYYA